MKVNIPPVIVPLAEVVHLKRSTLALADTPVKVDKVMLLVLEQSNSFEPPEMVGGEVKEMLVTELAALQTPLFKEVMVTVMAVLLV